MRYLTYRTTAVTGGTVPEATIDSRGGVLEASAFFTDDGLRLGYLVESADLSDLEAWNVAEIDAEAALAFAVAINPDAEFTELGYIGGDIPVTAESFGG